MTRYVSMLRGINVSGKNRILMVDLAGLYASLGFTAVTTYIQSGNVVFEAADKAAPDVRSIEKGIEDKFGFEVPVIIRSKSEFQNAVLGNPFSGQSGADPAHLYVTFLDSKPDKEKLNQFGPVGPGKDQYSLVGTEVYLNCPGGYGKTRLTNTYLEKQLGVCATTRNWKTVNVLLGLVQR